MEKRAVTAFFTSAVLAFSLILRIFAIGSSADISADSQKSTRRIDIAETRGMIYDRNMLPLVNTSEKTVLAVDPAKEAMECLKSELSEEEYKAADEKKASGKVFLLECERYSGQCDDIVPMTVYERYSETDCARSVIGYLDSEGNGVSGIEKAFDELLSKYSGTLSLRYTASSSGTRLRGTDFESVSDGYGAQGGIVLTLDKNIQAACEKILAEHSFERGCIIVLNAESSEILALATAPEFNRQNMKQSVLDKNSPFLNRCLNAYAVGSVFKPIVAAAALESGISADTVFECDGSVAIGSNRFNCHKRDGHGILNMSQAMAVSCNSYFIKLGQMVGAKKLTETAKRFGLGSEIELFPSVCSVSGSVPDSDSVDSASALANLSFGQGDLLATPLQMAAVYCIFASSGYYRTPYILKEQTDSNGKITAYYKNEVNDKVLTDSVCKTVCGMLENTVLNGSGVSAKPMCFNAAGKTATAETGIVENGKSLCHTWFCGFYPSENPEYVITVFNEDGSSGSADCAPVFRDVADAITSIYGS